jgi:hypothetical protein
MLKTTSRAWSKVKEFVWRRGYQGAFSCWSFKTLPHYFVADDFQLIDATVMEVFLTSLFAITILKKFYNL